MISPAGGGAVAPPPSGLALEWVGLERVDEVAWVRAASFGHSMSGLEETKSDAIRQMETRPAEWLLCRHEGGPVGTITSLGLDLWVRGASFSTLGIADVGTIKTWRGRRIGGTGVATAMMEESLRHARSKGTVLTALTPFRGSYYQRFGYGFVERRNNWTIPVTAIARVDANVRLATPEDAEAIKGLRRGVTRAGVCDLERCEADWAERLPPRTDAFVVVVEDEGGSIRGYCSFSGSLLNGSPAARVGDLCYADATALRDLLGYFSTLRDEFTAVTMTLPFDMPLNRLLHEQQMMHHTSFRIHQTVEARPFNRLMVRVLDHVALLQGLNLQEPPSGHVSGEAVVRVVEPEGDAPTLGLEFEGGRIAAGPTNREPDLTLSADVWAQLVMGELSAAEAVRLGLATLSGDRGPRCLAVLSGLAAGPAPWCHEFF